MRTALFAELTPVEVSNCRLERFGEPNEGGYLMCGNLLSSIKVGYSYGIAGYDQWGCDVARKLNLRVHQVRLFRFDEAHLFGRDDDLSCGMRWSTASSG